MSDGLPRSRMRATKSTQEDVTYPIVCSIEHKLPISFAVPDAASADFQPKANLLDQVEG